MADMTVIAFLIVVFLFFGVCWLIGEWQKMNFGVFVRKKQLVSDYAYTDYVLQLWRIQLIFRRYK